MSQVSLSVIGLNLIILDGELHENNRNIRRLENEISDRQERLNSLKARQYEISRIFQSATPSAFLQSTLALQYS